VTGRQERRRRQLLDDLKDTRGYWKLKEAALYRTVCRTCFGRSCEPAVGQTAEWMYDVTLFFVLKRRVLNFVSAR
jgi:hypothetical protein